MEFVFLLYSLNSCFIFYCLFCMCINLGERTAAAQEWDDFLDKCLKHAIGAPDTYFPLKMVSARPYCGNIQLPVVISGCNYPSLASGNQWPWHMYVCT